MKFDFKRRQCDFGVFNNRRERHGPDEKVKAVDLPMRFPLKPRELDMLCPTNGTQLSAFLFGDNLRKPELQCHLLSPIVIHRKPEAISLTIYDNPADKRRGMTFKDVKIKDPTVEIDDSGVPWLICKAQFEPRENLQRLSDQVECKKLEFDCYAEQPELFEKPDEDDDPSGQQEAPLEGGAGAEGDEDEDDED